MALLALPAYEVLDAIVRRYMENNESIASIVADGYAGCGASAAAPRAPGGVCTR